MSIFQGLYGYEQVMLALGILLFLVLVFLLLRDGIKGQTVSRLVTLFILSVIMIGFPSIQKVSYEDGKLELEKATHDLSSDPADSSSRQQVEAAMQKLTARGGTDPSALVTLAGAHWALGNYDSSQQLTQQALQMGPTDTSLRNKLTQLEGKIALHNQFKENISRLNGYLDRVQAGDKSEALAQSMVTLLDTLKKPTYVSTQDALTISKAYVALDRPAKALAIVSQAANTGTAAKDSAVLNFRRDLIQNSARINSLKLPESVLATKEVKEVSFEKNIIVQRPLPALKK